MSPRRHEGPGLLEGLVELCAIALVGYDELCAATSRPVEWIWYGIATAWHHIEIAGPTGEGKTTLATLLIVALANPTGRPVLVLGREVRPVDEGRYVVLIEEENGVHSVRSKLERACEALGLPARETIDRMVFVVRKGLRVRSKAWGDLERLAERGAIGALFIDTRARILTLGSSLSEDDQAKVAEILTNVIEKGGMPVFVISHTRKGDGRTTEDIAGSNQRGASADVVVMLTGKRDKNRRVVSSTATFTKIRDDLLDYPEPVTFTLAKQDGKWALTTVGSAPSDDTEAHERIFQLLLANGWRSKNQIRGSLGMNGETVEGAISRLFEERRIQVRTTRKGGKECKVFDVPPKFRPDAKGFPTEDVDWDDVPD